MEGEGQKIELKPRVGEPEFTMPEIVLKVVSSWFQSIKILIFDAPTTSSGLCDGLHSIWIERQGGDEIIVVNDFAAMGDLERQPVLKSRID